MAVPPFTIQLPPLTLSNVGKMRSDGVWIEQMWLIIIWWRRYAATLPTTRPSSDMIRIILIIIWWCILIIIWLCILIIRYWWYFIWRRRYAATSKQICGAICALWSIPWEVSFNLQNKTLQFGIWKCFVYTYTGPFPIIEHISLKPYHIIINPMSWRRAIEL